jgi:hypothetical protein
LTLDERTEAAERVLDANGCIRLPATLWPGATEAAVESALSNFYAVTERLGLDVERLGDGTRIAFRPELDDDDRKGLRRVAAASGN